MSGNLNVETKEKYLALKEQKLDENLAKHIDYIPAEYQALTFSFLDGLSFSEIKDYFTWSLITFIALIICICCDFLGIFKILDIFNPTILLLITLLFIFISEKSTFNTKKRKNALNDLRLDGYKKIEQRFLKEIQTNNLQSIAISNLILKENENAYWSEPAILEEPVNKSIELNTIEPLNVEVTPVCFGEVIVTNMRLVFMGIKKSYAVDLENISNIYFSESRLLYTEKNNPVPKYIKPELNTDIIKIVLKYFIKLTVNKGP
ncbi:MAG: hypothetical protein HQK93_04005 [Nitrospirae bacterium]|nr:hypothetical protein [Nitrospirota bacterium]